MYITQTEVKKILAVMEEFPDARSYKLEQTGQSGIGSILILAMDMDINGRKSLVKVEIAGVEDW
jgi:hypothetical protein